MSRRLLRKVATIATGLVLTITMFLGIGSWRRSQDAQWCERASAAGVVSGDQPLTSNLLEQIRSACTAQRQRQRVMFGAIWRTGGQEAAQCGFELARLQLISHELAEGYHPVLHRYGVDGSDFEVSSRQHQDRFLQACLSGPRHETG